LPVAIGKQNTIVTVVQFDQHVSSPSTLDINRQASATMALHNTHVLLTFLIESSRRNLLRKDTFLISVQCSEIDNAVRREEQLAPK
jgi:hypothetical protein